MAAKEKNGQEIEKAMKLEHVPWCDEYEKMISGMLYVYNALSNLSLLYLFVSQSGDILSEIYTSNYLL